MKKEKNKKSDELHCRDATAPYNFVPINKTVVSASDMLPQFDRYDGYTGYIDLYINTLTPLYIRDSYTKEEDNKANNKKKKWENADFFSPQGIPSIPGSSLRGMVRNLVEIVSFSKMEYIDNSSFYYRAIDDECKTLKDAYFERMGKKPRYRFSAGYLYKEGNNYYIRPAQKKNGKQYKRVRKRNLPYFSYHWQEDGTCITVSGRMWNKKKYDWLIYPPDNKAVPISLSINDSDAYRNDTYRMTDDKDEEKRKDISKREDGDLFRMQELEEKKKSSRKMVPCFYILWTDRKGKNRIYFGHTPYFRLPYELSVHDHLPSCHKEDGLDFVQILFGNTHWSAGKVFFEDAKLVCSIQQYDEISPAILSNPKPTTFQHYLEQGNAKHGKLAHWDNEPEEKTGTGFIRGYKLYWHRNTPQDEEYGWQAKKEVVEEHPRQYTKIKPIKGKFEGRIRFENLSDIELGGLLFVLDLPSKCAHKLGMGKPLGLGTVEITPHLVITDRSKGTDEKPGRYGRLFVNKKWHLPKPDVDMANFSAELKGKFSKFILEKLGESEYKDLWDHPRLKELKAMLYYDEQKMSDKNWILQTKYLEVEKFKDRAILDSPVNILKKSGIDLS